MSYRFFIYLFLSCVGLSYVLTSIACVYARRFGILDSPHAAPDRKKQPTSVPLLGGIGIALTSVVAGTTLWFLQPALFTNLLPKHMIGLLLASVVIIIGGYLDDAYSLTGSRSILFPFIATLIIIASGIGITTITNPLGGIILLDTITLDIIKTSSVHLKITLLSDIVTIIWVMGMTYTTKLLDGVDGLVSGLGAIASGTLFILSLFRIPVIQPDTASLALILSGAVLGAWLLNYVPARIYLGEIGSVYIGFMLAALSILSGSKIAIALLIMLFPIVDVAWLIVKRSFIDGNSPFKAAARDHLHFQFIDHGFSPIQTTTIYYTIAIVLAFAALILPVFWQFILGVAVFFSALLIIWRFYFKQMNL